MKDQALKTEKGNYLVAVDFTQQGDMFSSYCYVFVDQSGNFLRWSTCEEFEHLEKVLERIELPQELWQYIYETTHDAARGWSEEKDYPYFDSRHGTVTVVEAAEDCNCGSQIRHNNGGNYHDLKAIVFRPETSAYELWETTTSEFDDWEMTSVTKSDYQNLINSLLELDGRGWSVEINKKFDFSFDYEKLRRKVRDALNKTASNEAIVRCAFALNVKID